ncbi:MAG: diacylglycerol kinase (ATP) [Glaciecola sp.]|jgi:diacylglycerol kinase (ATP)
MQKNTPNIAKNESGIKRLPRAVLCSLKGYQAAWRYESGFRQYAFIAALLSPASLYIAQSLTHWFILIGCLVFVLFAELLNTAVEAISDATTPEYNELIGRAKDVGSAGVFTAILFAVLVWGLSIYQFFA